MAYITKEEIAALPEDPAEAFIEFENIVRTRFQQDWNRVPENEPAYPLYHKYASDVLPAVRHYDIAGLVHWKRADFKNAETYQRFMDDVDYCVSELKFIVATRLKRNSVALDASTKSKLRHLLDEIRQTVDKLDDPVKKDRLYSRINELQEEIDRERTPFEAVGNLFITACQYVAEGAKDLEPAVRLIERIGAAIGIAKQAEDTRPRLPPPAKQITHQKQAEREPNEKLSFDKKIDDEIPF